MYSSGMVPSVLGAEPPQFMTVEHPFGGDQRFPDRSHVPGGIGIRILQNVDILGRHEPLGEQKYSHPLRVRRRIDHQRGMTGAASGPSADPHIPDPEVGNVADRFQFPIQRGGIGIPEYHVQIPAERCVGAIGRCAPAFAYLAVNDKITVSFPPAGIVGGKSVQKIELDPAELPPLPEKFGPHPDDGVGALLKVIVACVDVDNRRMRVLPAFQGAVVQADGGVALPEGEMPQPEGEAFGIFGRPLESPGDGEPFGDCVFARRSVHPGIGRLVGSGSDEPRPTKQQQQKTR